MKSDILRIFVSFDGGDNPVFFTYSNQILAGIFKRICLDSLNPNNEHKNSLFPLAKSKICLISSQFFFKFCQLMND